MIKIAFVIVNRANYGRVKPLLIALNKNKKFNVKIIFASSALLKNYGKLEKILIKDGLKVDYKIFNHISGENNETMAKSVGLLTVELASLFANLNPKMVFTIADRYETLATSIAASYLNIFLVHLQGGEKTGSIDESVRHAVTKLSHLHLACTEKAKKRIIKMGENKKNVFNVGCPSIDIIRNINFKKKLQLEKYSYGVGYKVDLNKDYMVVLFHPDTTEIENSANAVENILHAVKKIDKQCVWIWPNPDAGSDKISNLIRKFRENNKKLKINFYTNFEPEDYLKLIKNAQCLIGNSSSGIRESSFLKIPVVNIGNRQKFRDRGVNVQDSSCEFKKIYKTIKTQYGRKINKSNNIYGRGFSTNKILNILKKIKININKSFQD